MTEEPSSAPVSAAVSARPAVPAGAAEPCDRCGAFAVLSRGEGGRYCEACQEKLRHELTPEELDALTGPLPTSD